MRYDSAYVRDVRFTVKRLLCACYWGDMGERVSVCDGEVGSREHQCYVETERESER